MLDVKVLDKMLRRIPRSAAAIFIGLLGLGFPALAQAGPSLITVFPLGGQRGQTLEVDARGTGLTGTYAVWLGPGTRLDNHLPNAQGNVKRTTGPAGIRAQVETIAGDSRATVRLSVSPDARSGFHTLGLITPQGLTGTIPFWVGAEAVIQESARIHNTPETAQAVKLPVAINGHISESGQLAHYAFTISRPQTMAFELISFHGAGFDPQLGLYEANGSYLDPRRFKRLVFHEEVTQGSMPASRRMTFHFTKIGRYFVSIGGVFAQAGKDSSYLLRIAPAGELSGEVAALSWARRRIEEISSRAAVPPAVKVALVKEVEPNDDPRQATAFEVPSVLVGTIGRPGDVDYFRFRAKAGQKLAFEIHTPRAGKPHFNPRLEVLTAKGAVTLTNWQVQDGKIGTQDAKVIKVFSEMVGEFKEQGEYVLRVRDISSAHGSADHRYCVLVRPQIPHLGDIRVQPSASVNLRPGARHRLTLTSPAKEGYSGTVALSVEGLPQGVKAFVGANGSTIELVADASAPSTPMPQVFRISGLALMGGKSGSPFLVAEIPLMVVKK
jgi:hypothetical protein